MSTPPGEGPARNLRSAVRDNRRIQATATGEWQVVDDTGSEATSRKLTTEELNEFAAEHADIGVEVFQLGHEVQNLREQLETVRREKNEAEARVAQNIEIGGIEEAEDKGGESDGGRVEEVAESMVTKRLAPLQNMIEELARSVATVMQGATTARQLETTSAQSDWGGMKIGEANRLCTDNLSAVSVKKTGDRNFAAARAC
jgi:hypothetical protein